MLDELNGTSTAGTVTEPAIQPGDHEALADVSRLRTEPGCFVSSTDLIAAFFARSTMFWIIAPELKSRKYRTSLSPLA